MNNDPSGTVYNTFSGNMNPNTTAPSANAANNGAFNSGKQSMVSAISMGT